MAVELLLQPIVLLLALANWLIGPEEPPPAFGDEDALLLAAMAGVQI